MFDIPIRNSLLYNYRVPKKQIFKVTFHFLGVLILVDSIFKKMSGSILNFSSTKSTFSLSPPPLLRRSQKLPSPRPRWHHAALAHLAPSTSLLTKGRKKGVAPEMVNQWEKPTKNFHVGKAIGSTIRNDNGGYNPFKYGWFRNVLLTYSTLMRLYWG